MRSGFIAGGLMNLLERIINKLLQLRLCREHYLAACVTIPCCFMRGFK